MEEKLMSEEKLLGGLEAPAKKHYAISKFITACGNFSVQYNFQAISAALIIMSASQCTSNDESCKEGDQAEWVRSTATATVFIGAIIGQLTMGYLGDLLGRNTAMTFTLSLVTISAFFSAIIPNGDASTIYALIIVCRFFLGVGAGGVYPLSAAKAAEDGGDKHGNVDPSAAGWAFFWQVPGTMTPWLMALLFTFSDISTSMKWRLVLGLGAIPAAMVVTCSIIESYQIKGRDDKAKIRNAANNEAIINDIEKRHQSDVLREMLGQADTWRKLAVTGGGWFIYDVAYYGVNLFGGQILQEISSTDDDNVSSDGAIRHITQQQFIALGMGIPACIAGIYCLKVMSSKTLQILGFFVIAIMFIILAACFFPLQKGNSDALFAIYCLLLFSLSFGPNLTTFILPAETFPKEVRATFNGISAAAGKLGAFAGVYMFGPVAEATNFPVVMILCAIISVFGAAVTYYFIPHDTAPAEERFRINSREDMISSERERSSLVAASKSAGLEAAYGNKGGNNDYMYE